MRESAGVLPVRIREGALEVFLVHPGGPFFARKDEGAWSIAKGEFDARVESAEDAARREFAEETGFACPDALVPLGSVRQRSGKVVHGFVCAAPNLDPAEVRGNTFEMEWPPRSGRRREFPEVDRAAWFSVDEARVKVNAAQAAFLERLVSTVAESSRATRIP
ncbi:MAG: NUDIX domain-containing protein [Bryobacteraceae bacterium]